jgi:hypothetical protein
MTVRVRKRQKALLPGAVMDALVSVRVIARVAREIGANHVGVTALETASRMATSTVAIADRVWAMRLFVPSARRWNAPKCRCANWRPKPMAKP